MSTNKNLLYKGLKFLGYTVVLMFTAPFTLYEAFKNMEHAFFIPVLVAGLILAVAAISFGFYSIKVLMDALFEKKS